MLISVSPQHPAQKKSGIGTGVRLGKRESEHLKSSLIQMNTEQEAGRSPGPTLSHLQWSFQEDKIVKNKGRKARWENPG